MLSALRRVTGTTNISTPFFDLTSSFARTTSTSTTILTNETQSVNATRGIAALPKLHYDLKDLSSVFSPKALDYHFNYVHFRDVRKANQAINAGPYRGRKNGVILRATAGDTREATLCNSLSSCWNHDHFWLGMTPGGVAPSEAFNESIELHFGSFKKLKEKFIDMAVGLNGNGWIWLVSRDGHLDLVPMMNSQSPGGLPKHQRLNTLLCADLWEHAYYIDYGPEVEDYLKNWFNVVDWEYVEFLYNPTIELARKVQLRRGVQLLPETDEGEIALNAAPSVVTSRSLVPKDRVQHPSREELLQNDPEFVFA